MKYPRTRHFRALVILPVILVSLLFGVSYGALAAPQESPTVTDADAVHEALRSLKSTMEAALNKRDLDTIVAHVHPNIVFVPMNAEIIRGRDGVRNYYQRMLFGPNKVVKDIHTTFDVGDVATLYGDTAIAWGTSKGHYVLVDGQEFDVDASWTCTIIKDQGRWLIAAFDYSTNMFDNPVLHLAVRRIVLIGIGAVLVALIVGWGVGRFSAKRKIKS